MKKLSSREVEILEYTAQGFTAKEIGKSIGIGYRSVEIYMARIKKKLGAKNVAHVIYIACQIIKVINVRPVF